MRRLILGLVTAGAVAGCGGGGDDAANRCDGFRVDREAWAAPDASARLGPGDASPRLEMAERIVRCETLAGADRREVAEQLGPPDSKDEEGTWYWDLGRQRELGGLDNELLFVMFDDDDRVTRVETGTS